MDWWLQWEWRGGGWYGAALEQRHLEEAGLHRWIKETVKVPRVVHEMNTHVVRMTLIRDDESGFSMWHVTLGGASGTPCGSPQEADWKWEQLVCRWALEPREVCRAHPCFH